jgi:hypothetical protein
LLSKNLPASSFCGGLSFPWSQVGEEVFANRSPNRFTFGKAAPRNQEKPRDHQVEFNVCAASFATKFRQGDTRNSREVS